MNIEIKKSLSVLELGGPAGIIEMQEKDIKLVDLSCEKRLELLLETLIQERENRLINRLIKNACFKYPSASIESLDYDARQIKKSTILNPATMGFAANATNLVITGPTGEGKTYLACALGVEACRQTYRVLYIRMPDLMRNFENQNDNLRGLTKYRKRIGNYQILIRDEWLNYKLTEKDAKNLYELFEQRSGNNATIFVGQYPVDEWHNRPGGGTQADSIMDRIIHNAYEIPTNETNLRKLYDSKKLKRLVDKIEA
ncbi:ATP-binding protein [Parablautia muri]|uniref:ATP-binding protein n=1 Tax=Parablautia muri TaxID=2320879 RepID=A0A9X5BFX0_9FIRM|nr:ATP-binding protein [Parablautia muri]NBJ92912.1 ATP-binding protein [Parablautia muri]